MSDVVPPEILSDILYRLPVISLVRFRSVSKEFRALIDSPHFIQSHLHQSLKTNSNQSIICDSSGLFTMDFDLFQNAFNTYHVGKVVGSSNGLVCLESYPDVLIANQSLQKHTALPPNKLRRYHWGQKIYNSIYGFGYDHVNDDYKVIRIVTYEAAGFVVEQNEVKVYSMKSNTWRKIKDFPHIPVGAFDNGVFVNGALHWMVTVNQLRYGGMPLPDKIVSFDIVTEEYREIPLPEYTPCMIPNKMVMELSELRGRLCVQCNYKKKNLDVWVMNTYGIADSWTKLYSIDQPIDSPMSQYLIALAYSKNGEKLLLKQSNGMLVWYDLKLEAVENSRIIDTTIYARPYIYTDSLIKVTVEKPKINSAAKTNVTHQKKKERKRKTPPSRDDLRLKGFK